MNKTQKLMREKWFERCAKAREGDWLEALKLARLCMRGTSTEHVLVGPNDLGLGELLDEVIAKEEERREEERLWKEEEEAKARETWADIEKGARKEPDGSEGYEEGEAGEGTSGAAE